MRVLLRGGVAKRRIRVTGAFVRARCCRRLTVVLSRRYGTVRNKIEYDNGVHSLQPAPGPVRAGLCASAFTKLRYTI